jgi:hypothetical protein
MSSDTVTITLSRSAALGLLQAASFLPIADAPGPGNYLAPDGSYFWQLDEAATRAAVLIAERG